MVQRIKLYFVIFSAFFLFSSFSLNKVEAGHFCRCVPTKGYTNCYVDRGEDVYFGPDIWSCTIFKTGENCCDPSKCGGESPCCYGCSDPDSLEPNGSCTGLKSVCQDDACPNTNDYNGRICEVIVPCSDGWGISHCKGLYGKWDASEKQCVTCDSGKQLKKIADTTQRCYTRLGGIWPETSCRGWQEESCASITSKCESACGADFRCDDFNPGERGNCPSDSYCTPDCQCYGYVTTIKPQPTTTSIRRPLRGAGGSRWAIPLGTLEGLGSPFVILAAILVILIIVAAIFGAFKFFAKKK
jgi:hypothetical protein